MGVAVEGFPKRLRHGHGLRSVSDAQRLAAVVDRRASSESRYHRESSTCALRVVSSCLVIWLVICVWKCATATDL
eukprot:4029271-Pyramimonas_sp.AAC.1